MAQKDRTTYGRHMREPKGYVANVGSDDRAHRFGGSAWTIVDPSPLGYGPTLLLTLDLSDPRLKPLAASGLRELPLCAYLNCISMGAQCYAIDADNRRVELVERKMLDMPLEMQDSDCLLPNPIPEKQLCLRYMEPLEYPVNEDAYDEAVEMFLSGRGMIRVLGPPIWLQDPDHKLCSCGKFMDYIASIGYEYELEAADCRFLDNEPFFPGEMGFYFYFCADCHTFIVDFQST